MNTIKVECEEQVADNCTTKKGWKIQESTIEYSLKWYGGKVICYPCQIKLRIASGNSK